MMMKKLTEHIIEALKIGSKSKVNQKGNFTDEELMDDYNAVGDSFSKSDKKPFMEKYGVNINKIRDIQINILDRLRENRHNKKQFNDEDVKYFIRYDLPWAKYDKVKTYLDEEPKEFLEYALSYYDKKAKKIHPFRQSIAEKYTLRIYNSLKRYLI